MSIRVGEVQSATVVNTSLTHEHLMSMQEAGKIRSSISDTSNTKSNFVDNYKQEQNHDKNNGLSPN